MVDRTEKIAVILDFVTKGAAKAKTALSTVSKDLEKRRRLSQEAVKRSGRYDRAIGGAEKARGDILFGEQGRTANILQKTRESIAAKVPFERARQERTDLLTKHNLQRKALKEQMVFAKLEASGIISAQATKRKALASEHTDQRTALRVSKERAMGRINKAIMATKVEQKQLAMTQKSRRTAFAEIMLGEKYPAEAISGEKRETLVSAGRVAEQENKKQVIEARIRKKETALEAKQTKEASRLRATAEKKEAPFVGMKEEFRAKKEALAKNQELEKRGVEAEFKRTSAEKMGADSRKRAAMDTQRVSGMEVKGLAASQTQIEINKDSMLGFGGVMSMNFDRWKQMNTGQNKFNVGAGKAANRVRMMTHGMRGFKMELLSVMFFGMAIQRLFMGLLQPALQLSGAIEVFTSILQILFLPTAFMVLGWVMSLLEWINKLSPAQKEMANRIVQIGAVLGGLLMVIGTVGLGIGGLIVAFASWGTAIGFIGTSFGKMASFLIAHPIFLVLIAAVILFRYAWINNFGRIKQTTYKIVYELGNMFRNLQKGFALVKYGFDYVHYGAEKAGNIYSKTLFDIEEARTVAEEAMNARIDDADAMDLEAKAAEEAADSQSRLNKILKSTNESLGFETKSLDKTADALTVAGSNTIDFANSTNVASISVAQLHESIALGTAESAKKLDELFVSAQKVNTILSKGRIGGAGVGAGTFFGPGGEFTGSYEDALDEFYGNLPTPEIPSYEPIKYEVPTYGEQSFLPEQGYSFSPMAKGGIVTSPTIAMIGEAGAEAVIPLNKMSGVGHTDNRTINITVSPNIYVTEEIKEELDIRKLGDELSDRWTRDIESMLRTT